MHAAKFPVINMLGQGLSALFRARTHLHPVTVISFLLMAAIFAGVLIAVAGENSVAIYQAIGNIDGFMLPVLIIYSFWLYRRFRLRPLGARRPVLAFLQMLLFGLFMFLVMLVFTILGGVSIFVGVSLFDMQAGATAVDAISRLKAVAFAFPAILAGLLVITRLMPGFAAAARGDGLNLSRIWHVLAGNFWRYFAAMLLFNVIVGAISMWVASLFWGYGEQVAVTQNFSVWQFYAFAALAMFIHLWNTAGVAFITGRAYDLHVNAGNKPAAAEVDIPLAKAEAPLKNAPIDRKQPKKTAVKKAAVKKPVAKKPTAKKVATKKAAPKKAAPKKPAKKTKKA